MTKIKLLRMDILNASTARSEAAKNKAKRVDVELKGIGIMIGAAVKEGKTEINVYDPVSSEAQEVLARKGYKVSTQFDRSEEITTISWAAEQHVPRGSRLRHSPVTKLASNDR